VQRCHRDESLGPLQSDQNKWAVPAPKGLKDLSDEQRKKQQYGSQSFPATGIGKEVVPEGLRVLGRPRKSTGVSRGISIISIFPSWDITKRHGQMMRTTEGPESQA